MKPQLRSIDAETIEIETYHPRLEDWSVTVALEIGPHGSTTSDLFYLTVCSPTAIREEVGRLGFRWGAATLVLPEWSLPVLQRKVEELCREVSADSWPGCARLLARRLNWEFD